MRTDHAARQVPGSQGPLPKPGVVYRPPASVVAASQLTAFRRHCAEATGRPIPDERSLYRFSVERYRKFWRLFVEWSGIEFEGQLEPTCTSEDVESARFFPNLQLSYAQNLLRIGPGFEATRPALTARHASGSSERFTRQELRDRVLGLADALTALGIRPGDRVVALMPNDAHAIIAGLATAAIGAIFASAAPDMGAPAILSRFGQLDPALLIVGVEAAERSSSVLLGERLDEVASGLPSLRAIVALDDGPVPRGGDVPTHRLNALMESPPSQPADREWPRFAFDHPLFVLFSSGTTGLPKCLIHGAGGTLVEHLKEHRLHVDLRPHDKLFFHTSTAWMMWNWQLSALASGAEIVVYDGPAFDPSSLWRIVSEENVTIFGTSPLYLQLCEGAGYSPRRELPMQALRTLMSTGSILYERQYDWVLDNVGSIPTQSISGGTDIVGCFVLGNPNLPVVRGESQCRSLGLDVQSVTPKGSASARIGELVCRKPFPSRPLGLYGDRSGSRFHDTYFSQHPGMWTHGDLIELTDRASARMHGRSDGVLNARGVRIGPAEIYRVLGSFVEIQEAMAVEQRVRHDAGHSRIVLLLVIREGFVLDEELRARIRRALTRDASAAHVPGLMVQVDEVPHTYSGKPSERSARHALNGDGIENAETLRNPGCLTAIADRVGHEDAAAKRARVTAAVTAGPLRLEQRLAVIWRQVLGIPHVGDDDDFFEIGGTSLLTVPLFQAVHEVLGCDLPISTIIAAPTVASMAALIREGSRDHASSLVLLKDGPRQRPLFLAPGMHGDVLGLRPLARKLRDDRAVYGLRARGLNEGETPWSRIEQTADHHLAHIRALQPHGPYALAGYSIGGLVAFEIARRLRAAGEGTEFVGLIDPPLPWRALDRSEQAIQAFKLPLSWLKWITFDARGSIRRGAGWLKRGGGMVRSDPESPAYLSATSVASWHAYISYRPRPHDGSAVLFKATGHHPRCRNPLPTWTRLAAGGLSVVRVTGDHADLLREPHLSKLAEAFGTWVPRP